MDTPSPNHEAITFLYNFPPHSSKSVQSNSAVFLFGDIPLFPGVSAQINRKARKAVYSVSAHIQDFPKDSLLLHDTSSLT